MFWLRQPLRLALPWPVTPTMAMFSFSEGDLGGASWALAREETQTPRPAAAEDLRNLRRLIMGDDMQHLRGYEPMILGCVEEGCKMRGGEEEKRKGADGVHLRPAIGCGVLKHTLRGLPVGF